LVILHRPSENLDINKPIFLSDIANGLIHYHQLDINVSAYLYFF
jgi:hypothetical protein